MNGQLATAKEIKARWGFGEVLSDRFRGPYKQILQTALYNQITGGCRFNDVQQNDWEFLIQGLNTARKPVVQWERRHIWPSRVCPF